MNRKSYDQQGHSFTCQKCNSTYKYFIYNKCPQCGCSYEGLYSANNTNNIAEQPQDPVSKQPNESLESEHVHHYEGKTNIELKHYHAFKNDTGKIHGLDEDGNHVHLVFGETACSDGHTHFYEIYTGPVEIVDGGHIHSYQIQVCQAGGHCHLLLGKTGLPKLLSGEGGYFPNK